MGIAPPEGSGRISSAPPWIHEDLNEATKMAVREMIDFLATEKRLARDEAYMLTSVAADVNITQLVDGNKGVHAMIPKAIFTNR